MKYTGRVKMTLPPMAKGGGHENPRRRGHPRHPAGTRSQANRNQQGRDGEGRGARRRPAGPACRWGRRRHGRRSANRVLHTSSNTAFA